MAKVDFAQLVILKTFVFVGDKTLPPSMSQKLGPLGLNAKTLVVQIQKDCKEWEGARIFIEIHAQNKQAKIVPKPGVSAYIIKEMTGFTMRDRKKEKLPNRSGNITFDQVLKIARLMEEQGKSGSKDFCGSVKQVLGSCMTVGCTVDGQSPKEITKKVNLGEYKCQK
jgi:large subunit ribosomal protein L12e